MPLNTETLAPPPVAAEAAAPGWAAAKGWAEASRANVAVPRAPTAAAALRPETAGVIVTAGEVEGAPPPCQKDNGIDYTQAGLYDGHFAALLRWFKPSHIQAQSDLF